MKDKVSTILEAKAPPNIAHEKRKLSTPELNTLVGRLHATKKQLSDERAVSINNFSTSVQKTTKTVLDWKKISKSSNGPTSNLV